MIPVLVLPLPLVVPGDEAKCGAMALIMALYWMLDLLPLAVTALLPVALAPPLAILGTNDVSMLYMRGTCMLFLGGGQVTLVQFLGCPCTSLDSSQV